MQAGNTMFDALRQAGFAADRLDAFRFSFQRSGLYSIDAFLQNRPDQAEVGKSAIAFQIMSQEVHGSLYAANPGTDWYRHLVNRMSAPLGKFTENQVAFITFNYDRSLEYYLVQHLAGAHQIGDAQAFEIISKIPIIHLHGDVGALPWAKEHGRCYNNEIRAEQLTNWAKRIHIVHDELADRESRFADAIREMQSAELLLFLGFSFDPINTDRLRLDSLRNPGIGTCYGFTQLEKNATQARLNNRVNLYDFDCLGMLRNTVQLS
jgi:hypothetical protein